MITGVMSDAGLSVAANSVSLNVYAGKLYEILFQRATIRCRVAAAAVGINATLYANGVAVVPDQAVSRANRWPILPDDLLTQFDFPAGRLVLTFRNTTIAAILVDHVTEVFM